MTTHKKYSLKEALLQEVATQTDEFIETLTSSVTSASFDGYADSFSLKQGECTTVLEIHIDDPNESIAWVNSLSTLGKEGKPSPDCYRKGFGGQMMQALVQAADAHGITLELIAAPPAYLKRQMPELPDKDQLAEFYGDYGFHITQKNSAQVFMRRDPSPSPA